MTIIESIQYYLPELMQAMEETLIMMSISIFAAVLIGLPLGILLFISRENNNQGNDFVSNIKFADHGHSFVSLFTVCCCDDSRHSFLLGGSFGPIPASIPLSIVSIVVYARLVEQVLLDVPEDVVLLARLIRVSPLINMSKEFLLGGSKKRVNPVSDDNDRQYGWSYSTVMESLAEEESETLPSVGYQRYEYGVMYFAILVMIVAVLVFS